jgi:putative lipoprotein
MKNSIIKFSLTALAAFTLAACGSSGGGNSDNTAAASHDQKTQVTPAKPEVPAKSEEPSKPAEVKNNPTDGRISGNGFQIPKSGGTIGSLIMSSSSTEANVNVINVEGTQIHIIPEMPGVTLNAKLINGDNFGDGVKRVVGGTKNNIRWGFVDSNNLKNSYIVAGGKNATASMPVSGTVAYEGKAVYGYAKNGNAINTVTDGNVTFQANFADKTLTGKITPNGNALDEVNLSATISGNTFAGKLNGTSTEGGFYGKNADELTGTYLNEQKRYLGAFGAERK